MGHPRRVQHRQRSEAKEVELKTELQKLRTQNQKLRRENARLRRDNDKLRSHLDEIPEEIDEELVAPPEPKIKGCPNGCGVELRRLQTPAKSISVCPECMWRKVE